MSLIKLNAAEVKRLHINQLENSLRQHLDSVCRAHDFDSYHSALNWAGFANPYQAHAQQLAEWVASCWSVHFAAITENPLPEVVAYLEKMPEIKLL